MPKPKLGYKIKELSPTRILVENNSFFSRIKKEEIAAIVEDLTSGGKKVISTIPFTNQGLKGGRDYLIILQP